MKARIAILTLMTCLSAGIPLAQARGNATVESLLHNLGTEAPADQVTRLRGAIASSPALKEQLDALVASGLLTDVAIGDAAAQVPRRGPFSAWFHDGTWAFTADFIAKHGKQRLFDVVQPDDILPDNLVFVLGHMAYEARMAKEIAAKEASLQAAFKAQADAGNRDATSMIKQSMTLHIENDASATIQGWNDTVDAAQHENGGRELTARQAADLLMNLQYRGVLIKAMQAPGDSKLLIANNGHIAMTQANVAAVSKALGTSAVFDVQ